MDNLIRAKILVIDDDVEIQELMVAYFKPKGFEVLVNSNPIHSLDEISKGKIAVDLILLDLQLPEMNGIEFIKKFNSLKSDIPVIVISANKTIDTAIQTIEIGAYDFLMKPIFLPQLMVGVERALHWKKLKSENPGLKSRNQIKDGSFPEGIIGRSPGFKKVMEMAKKVASSQANVFIGGESGTGKEVVAKAIHNFGPRSKKEFVALNCASIPESLLESELFGYAKGSFTGAIEKRIGLFEEAEGGTLFLDEIGDLSLPLQAKILRVLQERQIKRIGENKYRTVDVRILSATHRDLKKEVAEGRFREDLYFRLNVIEIRIPPLRERREDIQPLLDFFLEKFSHLNGIKIKEVSADALEAIHAWSWPGNVRELENAVERSVILCASDGIIRIEDLPDWSAKDEQKIMRQSQQAFDEHQGVEYGKTLTVDEMVKRYIKIVLDKNNGMKDKTATELNIDRKTLYRKLKEMEMGNH